MKKIAYIAVVILLAGCSLHTSAPTFNLKVSPPNQSLSRPEGRTGPALNDMSYSVTFIGPGAESTFSTSELGNRDLACLFLNGSVHGPYTYEEITGLKGISLSAPSGNFGGAVAVNGYYPKNTSQTIPAFTTVATNQIFNIGQVSLDTATSLKASLSAANYLAQTAPEELRAKCIVNQYSAATSSAPGKGICRNSGSVSAYMWIYISAVLDDSCPVFSSSSWGLPIPQSANVQQERQCSSSGGTICCVTANSVGSGNFPAGYSPRSVVATGVCGL